MTIEEMKERKRELGYSNREISERSGIPFGTVQKIFSGKTVSPRHETIKALEMVLENENKNEAGQSPHYYARKPVRYDTIPQQSDTLMFQEEQAVYHTNGFEKKPGNDLPNRGRFPAMVSEATADYGIPGKKQGEYTIEDWENLPDSIHAELINGYLYDMATPSTVHQALIMALADVFYQFVRKNHGACRVFPAPYGIRIFRDNKTMVEPDISVVCDSNRIKGKWTDGAPDLVVEVLSPSNRKHDIVDKLKLYEEAGVREYWIVDPSRKRVMVYVFDDADIVHIYTFQDKIPVGIWNGECVVDFAEIYEEISYLYDDKGNLR